MKQIHGVHMLRKGLQMFCAAFCPDGRAHEFMTVGILHYVGHNDRLLFCLFEIFTGVTTTDSCCHTKSVSKMAII